MYAVMTQRDIVGFLAKSQRVPELSVTLFVNGVEDAADGLTAKIEKPEPKPRGRRAKPAQVPVDEK